MGLVFTTTLNIPSETKRVNTNETIITVLGLEETIVPNDCNILLTTDSLCPFCSFVIIGFVFGNNEETAGMNNQLASNAKAIPIAANIPICPAGIKICP